MAGIGRAVQGVSVVTDALRTYSEISSGMATEVAVASGSQALSSQVELAGAFGPIGKGFLAAFHRAEAAHLHGASQVSLAHETMARQSATSAEAYDTTDDQSAALTGALRSAASVAGAVDELSSLALPPTGPREA